MTSQDTKDPPLDPAPPDPEASPFVPARGMVLDGTDAEAVRASDSEVEPSMAPNADIEQISESPPEQIDPGSHGKPVI